MKPRATPLTPYHRTTDEIARRNFLANHPARRADCANAIDDAAMRGDTKRPR
jgi:hypothetical protein